MVKEVVSFCFNFRQVALAVTISCALVACKGKFGQNDSGPALSMGEDTEDTNASNGTGESVLLPAVPTTSNATSSVSSVNSSAQATSNSTKQPKCTLTANPATVSWGASTTLSWSSSGATRAQLNNDMGEVALSGSHGILTLVNGTTFTVTVSGPGGSATCSATITVTNLPPALPYYVSSAHLGLPALTYVQGPIVIENQTGVTVFGQAIYNHGGPCLIIRNSSNIRIVRNQFFECGKNYPFADGAIVKVENSSYVTIEYNYFSDGGLNSLAILGTGNAHLKIDHNHFLNVAGGVGLWEGTAQTVTYNRFLNMLPRAGALSGFVQFVKAYGGLNTIACNTGANEPWVVPQTGDLINIYMSNGVPHSPIQVYGNKLVGSGSNLDGPGLASAGIQTGDGSFSSHIRVFFNQLVNVDSGIQVSGGDTIEVSHNRVFAAGRSGYYTSGMGMVNFYGAPGQAWTKAGAFCRNIHVHNNAIDMASDSQSRALMIDFSSLNNWPNCENLLSENNNITAIMDASIVNGNPAPGCSE